MIYKLVVVSLLFLTPFFANATLTGNILLSSSCTDTGHYTGSYGCEQVIDQNNATAFYKQSTTAEMRFDTTTAYGYIRQLTIKPWTGTGAPVVKHIELRGSNNDTDYFLITTTTINNENSGAMQTLTLSSSTTSTAYRYFKFNFIDAWDGTSAIGFEELGINSCTDCAPATSTTFGTSTARDTFNYKMSFLLDGLIIALVGYGIYKFTYGRHPTI